MEGGPSSVRARFATEPPCNRCVTTYGGFTEGQEAFHAGFTTAGKIVTQFSTTDTPNRSETMASSETFRMTLTPEQKEQVRKSTGKEAEAIELSVEELEERIAPVTARPKKW
jgi:hypothetical protein